MFWRDCSLAEFARVPGFTDPGRGLFGFDKESRPCAPALKNEPKTAKYPAQIVRITELCAGENKVEKGGGRLKAGHPRRQLEQRFQQLAGVRPQQRRVDEHEPQQQYRVSCCEYSSSKEVKEQSLTIQDYYKGGFRMKTYNHLFEKIISFENLILAAQRAQKGKRLRKSTAEFNFFMEQEIFKLQDELKAQTYQPGRYRQFYVYEPKARLISAAPYRDRVAQQAFCGVVEPIFESRFIEHSYACRKGKGTHKAILRCQEFTRKNPYVFKSDILGYFPAINHSVLYDILAKRIKDKKVLWLIRLTIDSANGLKVKAGDREGVISGVGLPIGNLTSQFFANVYLNELDYFVKFELREKYYIRYMDDFLVFGEDKSRLRQVKEGIRQFLCEHLNLNLHPNKSTIFPVKSGVDFCGFRVFPYYRRLRRGNVKVFVKRIKKIQMAFSQGSIGIKQVSGSIRAWVAHASWANTYRLRKKLFSQLILKRSG